MFAAAEEASPKPADASEAKPTVAAATAKSAEASKAESTDASEQLPNKAKQNKPNIEQATTPAPAAGAPKTRPTPPKSKVVQPNIEAKAPKTTRKKDKATAEPAPPPTPKVVAATTPAKATAQVKKNKAGAAPTSKEVQANIAHAFKAAEPAAADVADSQAPYKPSMVEPELLKCKREPGVEGFVPGKVKKEQIELPSKTVAMSAAGAAPENGHGLSSSSTAAGEGGASSSSGAQQLVPDLTQLFAPDSLPDTAEQVAQQRDLYMAAELVLPGIALKKMKQAMAASGEESQHYFGGSLCFDPRTLFF